MGEDADRGPDGGQPRDLYVADMRAVDPMSTLAGEESTYLAAP